MAPGFWGITTLTCFIMKLNGSIAECMHFSGRDELPGLYYNCAHQLSMNICNYSPCTIFIHMCIVISSLLYSALLYFF